MKSSTRKRHARRERRLARASGFKRPAKQSGGNGAHGGKIATDRLGRPAHEKGPSRQGRKRPRVLFADPPAPCEALAQLRESGER